MRCSSGAYGKTRACHCITMKGRENLFDIFGILVFQESFSLFQIKIIECMTVFVSHLTFIAWSISEIKAYHCFALVAIPKVMRVIGLVREFMHIWRNMVLFLLSKMKLMIQTGQNRSASWKFWYGVVILIFPNIFLKKHMTKTAIRYGNALVSFLIMIGKQKEPLPRRRKRRKMHTITCLSLRCSQVCVKVSC